MFVFAFFLFFSPKPKFSANCLKNSTFSNSSQNHSNVVCYDLLRRPGVIFKPLWPSWGFPGGLTWPQKTSEIFRITDNLKIVQNPIPIHFQWTQNGPETSFLVSHLKDMWQSGPPKCTPKLRNMTKNRKICEKLEFLLWISTKS